MRTLQIGDDWPGERITGLNRYFFELARYLPQTGTQVESLVVGPANLSDQAGGSVHAFAESSEKLWTRLRKARRTARRVLLTSQVDLVASHFALYTAALSSDVNSLPFVVHFHGPWAAESNVEGSSKRRAGFKLALERRVYHRARRLIVLSRSFQEQLVTQYGIDERLIRLVPGGIDTDRFNLTLSRAEARERLGWPQDRPILLAVRRQVRRMGLENLIDAMKQVVQTEPDALLLLGGTGPIEGELEQRISGLGLQHNVKRLGRVSESNLPVAYRAANFSVVPSQALEGFGLITLESLASGTPVLVTPIGGLPEVVEPFSPQCLFADSSPSAMASLLQAVLKGAQSLPSAEECRAYAVERFSWTRIAQQVREVYDEALSAG